MFPKVLWLFLLYGLVFSSDSPEKESSPTEDKVKRIGLADPQHPGRRRQEFLDDYPDVVGANIAHDQIAIESISRDTEVRVQSPVPVPLAVPVSPSRFIVPQPSGGPPPPSTNYAPPPPPRAPNPNYAPPPPQPVYAAPIASSQNHGFGAPRPNDIFNLPPLPQPSHPAPSAAAFNAPPPTGNFGPISSGFGPPQAPPISHPLPPPPNQIFNPPQAHARPIVPLPQPTYSVLSDSEPSPSINAVAPGDPWPIAAPEMPQIIALDVKCEKNLMQVSIEFDRPFYGIMFSKGHYSNVNCVHLPAGLGRNHATFDISINSCGTTGNTETGLYGYGSQSGAGTYFENTVVIQYDPQVQEVWDQARKLRCTWHDQYEKSVTFRPFPVDMLDVVRADFAGDNVGCWMQIQVGKGPWASEVSGLVKIGQTMTMVLAIKDDDNKFDMLVRNCMAHDGKRAPIQLVDQRGCVTRPKLMSRFSKIKNFGASASVLSYAHFQAFKFPDSMEVHFQCTIQICRHQCPEQCADENAIIGGYDGIGRRSDGRKKRETDEQQDKQKDIGVNRVIQVVSTRDLTFILDKKGDASEMKESATATLVSPFIEDQSGLICMSTPGFAATLVILLSILFISCLLSAFLCLRFRGHGDTRSILSASFENPAFLHKKGHF